MGCQASSGQELGVSGTGEQVGAAVGWRACAFRAAWGHPDQLNSNAGAPFSPGTENAEQHCWGSPCSLGCGCSERQSCLSAQQPWLPPSPSISPQPCWDVSWLQGCPPAAAWARPGAPAAHHTSRFTPMTQSCWPLCNVTTVNHWQSRGSAHHGLREGRALGCSRRCLGRHCCQRSAAMPWRSPCLHQLSPRRIWGQG